MRICINADIFGCTAQLGRKLSEVVGEHGAKRFNQTLTEMLEYQVEMENIVVTTDENIVSEERARAILKDEFTVYLTASTTVLVERLSNYRPLLPVRDYFSLIDEIKDKNRALFKEVASLSLDSDTAKIDEHVATVINGSRND